MFDHRDDVHEVCLRASFIGNQFNEANETLAQKGTDENAVVEKCRFLLVNRLNVLAIVSIRLP